MEIEIYTKMCISVIVGHARYEAWCNSPMCITLYLYFNDMGKYSFKKR